MSDFENFAAADTYYRHSFMSVCVLCIIFCCFRVFFFFLYIWITTLRFNVNEEKKDVHNFITCLLCAYSILFKSYLPSTDGISKLRNIHKWQGTLFCVKYIISAAPKTIIGGVPKMFPTITWHFVFGTSFPDTTLLFVYLIFIL